MNNNNPSQHFIELNIQSKYEQLLKVKFQHDYFSDKALKNLEIIPDELTKIRLKQLQLKYVQEGSTLTLGYGKTTSIGPLVNEIRERTKLTFWIKIKDANFLNYTSLPFELGNQIYHFTNLCTDKMEEQMNLSSDLFVHGRDRIPVSGPVFDYRFSEALESPKIELIDEFGHSVFDRECKGSTSVCTINLTQNPSGKYSLLVDGLEEFSFYMTTNLQHNIFGVVDLYLDPNDLSAYSIFENKLPKSNLEYFVHFQNRAVQWKYLIIESNQYNPQHKDHSIVDFGKGEQRFEFSEAEKIILNNQTEAYLIRSKSAIPFQENQHQQFKLKTLRGKNEMEWTTDLPNASAREMLKTENNSKKDFFSEILIYL